LTLALAFVVAAAFAAGLVDAMAGGGGLITIPALFAALPQTPHADLLGTSKVASLSGSLSAVARYARHVRFDWPLLRRAAVAAFTASLAGAWLATRVSPLRFRALVPVMLAAVLVYTLLQRDFGRRHTQHAVPFRPALTIAGAAIIGGYDFLHASAAAKIVNCAANVAAIVVFGVTSDIHWLLAFALAIATVLGAQVGSHLAIRRGAAFVRIVFLVVVGSLIAKTAHDAWLAAH
jgi:hypothetical protein